MAAVVSFDTAGGDAWTFVKHIFGDPELVRVTDRLDEIAELGATAIWLSPVMAAPEDDFGYAVLDPFRLRASFGDARQFRGLVDRAHALGLKVLMDFVPNHLSDRNRYFLDAERHGAHSPYYDWFELGALLRHGRFPCRCELGRAPARAGILAALARRAEAHRSRPVPAGGAAPEHARARGPDTRARRHGPDDALLAYLRPGASANATVLVVLNFAREPRHVRFRNPDALVAFLGKSSATDLLTGREVGLARSGAALEIGATSALILHAQTGRPMAQHDRGQAEHMLPSASPGGRRR